MSGVKQRSAKHLESLLDRGVLWSASGSSSTNKAPESEALLARFGPQGIDDLLPLGGLPFGKLHEFSLELSEEQKKHLKAPLFVLSQILAATKQNERLALHCNQIQKHYIVWIGRSCWPTPHVLEYSFQKSSWREHCLFLDPKDKESRIWSIAETLRHRCVFAVIADTTGFSQRTYQKLQIACARGVCFGLMLRRPEEQQLPSPAYSRWRLTPAMHEQGVHAWTLTLLKIKGSMKTGTELPRSWQLYCNEDLANGTGALDILSETRSTTAGERRTYALA